MRKPQCVDPRVNVHKIWRAASVGARSRADGADRTGIFKDDGTDGRTGEAHRQSKATFLARKTSFGADSGGMQFKWGLTRAVV